MKGEKRFMLTKDDRLKAVYSTELDMLLEKVGLLEKFNSGEIVCHYCKSTISRNNLYAIIPYERKIVFCCNKPCCVLSLSKEAE